MIENVERFIRQWNMAGPGDRVIAAVSGGADSVCLCLVLHSLSERIGFSLRVVHVEHGIRGEESTEDAAFVERLCRSLGLACTVHHVRVPEYAKEHRLGVEEAARLLRYGVLRREAEREGLIEPGSGRVRVALAHHMEDNAETMLLQLVRGTGLDGLCGMQPVRVDVDEDGGCGACYIRPLLTVSRVQIESFLASRGQEYRQDSTNSDPAYSRNRIRSRVMPELAAVNAQAVMHMNRTAERLLELRSYLDSEADRIYASAVRHGAADAAGLYQQGARSEQPGLGGGEAYEAGLYQQGGRSEQPGLGGGEAYKDCLYILGNELEGLPQVLVQRTIHRAVAEAAGGRKDIGAVHIRAVQELFGAQCGRRIDLPGSVEARRVYGGVRLCRRGLKEGPEAGERPGGVSVSSGQLADCAKKGAAVAVPCGTDGARLVLRTFAFCGNPAEISTKMYTKWFDYDMIKDGFSIRTRENGDYFVLDEAGHRKKLKRYFIDQKIPLEQRDRILLLARGGEVLWVIGGRMGYSAMVTEDTRIILEARFEP